MRLKWGGSPRNQKVISSTVLLILALACIALFIPQTFVPYPGLTLMAAILAFVANVFFFIFVWRSIREGAFKPSEESVRKFKDSHQVKKIIMVPLCLVFFIFATFISLENNLPYIYTKLFGENGYMDDLIVKGTYTTRRSFGIRYELSPKSIHSFFRFTISKEEFDSLPEGEIPARLLIKESPIGFIVESIKFDRGVLKSTHF